VQQNHKALVETAGEGTFTPVSTSAENIHIKMDGSAADVRVTECPARYSNLPEAGNQTLRLFTPDPSAH